MERWKPKNFLDLNLQYFVRWTLSGILMGLLGGLLGAAFGYLIGAGTSLRLQHEWLVYLMPLAGLLIVFLYAQAHELDNSGTNMVIDAIHGSAPVRKRNGALIFVATVLSHLTGASVGKEGAALQIGGSLGAFLAHKFRLDEADGKILLMTGMSAVFGAVFGTPLGAAVFPVEVVSIGIMYYTALLPCLLSATIGSYVGMQLGVHPEHFAVAGVHGSFAPAELIPFIFLGIGCALVSILLCETLHRAAHLYQRYLPNHYLRILLGAIVLIFLTFPFGRDYLGSGSTLIDAAISGNTDWYSFLLKILFTAVALGAGFKGGEIVPTLTVGACFGCATGPLLGLDPSFAAACGMVGLFCGVTNCPMASMFLAVEMFGGEGMICYALVIVLSYALSGYSSLYRAQRFMYAKTKARYINRTEKGNEFELLKSAKKKP